MDYLLTDNFLNTSSYKCHLTIIFDAKVEILNSKVLNFCKYIFLCSNSLLKCAIFKCHIHIRPGTIWCILKSVTFNLTFKRKKLKEDHKFPHLHTRLVGQHLWKDKEKQHNFQLLGADLCKRGIFFQLIWILREKKMRRSQISTFSTLCTI